MALTTADVTHVRSWETPVAGGPNIYNRIVDLTMSGTEGGTSDDITAAVLGFHTIYYVVPILGTFAGPTYGAVPVIVESDNAGLLTINLCDATDATRKDPADIPAGTLRVLVVGLRAQ